MTWWDAHAQILGAWAAAGLTLCMFSFLYEDNPFYKLGEHLYVGVSLGYIVVQVLFLTMIPKWWKPLIASPHHWELLIPAGLGILMLCHFVPKAAWLSRWTMALMMGLSAGTAIPASVASLIFTQVQGTVQPLVLMKGVGGQSVVDTGAGALWGDFSALFVLVGVISVLVYFFFSVEHKGPVKAVSKVGILFLMISFGASYGFTVQGRFALLYDRFVDLKEFGMPGYHYASYILAGILIALLAVLRLRRREGGTPPQA